MENHAAEKQVVVRERENKLNPLQMPIANGRRGFFVDYFFDIPIRDLPFFKASLHHPRESDK